MMRLIGRWFRRVVVVLVGLTAGWMGAGYADGYLPGTITHSTTIRGGAMPRATGGADRASATQPAAVQASATQPAATQPKQEATRSGEGGKEASER